MKSVLYYAVGIVARLHAWILTLNDTFEYNFTDKELHFLVIGVLGMGLVLLIHPFFTILAKSDHVMVITWFYVTTLMVVITFAIEIGQKVTNTGAMEFGDIVFGLVGFFAMFAVFAVIRGIFKMILGLFRRGKKK